MNQVLEIIHQRHREQSQPHHRNDPYKLGLAIEGGGMRGIVSNGALIVLDELNLRHVFDVVYGSSAGAYNGAYFLAGQSLDASKLYLDFVNNHDFINYWRFLRGGPVMDLKYLHRRVMESLPVNFKAVISAVPPLHIIATDVDRARPITFKLFKSSSDLLHALYASAHLPDSLKILPFRWRRHKYFDAGLLDPFGIHSALNEKCTHVLVIFSKPYKHRHTFGIMDKELVAPQLKKINKHLGELYLKHFEYSVNGLSSIWNHYDGTHIMAVAPSRLRGLPGPVTLDRGRLGRGLLAGAEALFSSFDVDEFRQKLIIKTIKQELKL